MVFYHQLFYFPSHLSQTSLMVIVTQVSFGFIKMQSLAETY